MKKKYVYLILCICWMGVIFWFSAQVADESTQMSDGILVWVERVLHVDLIQEGNVIYDVAAFIVRKLAHMSEYAVLGILFYLYAKEVVDKKVAVFAIVGVLLYAISDEVHQLFVPGRSGKLLDVCIDTFGGSIGVFLIYLLHCWKTNKKIR